MSYLFLCVLAGGSPFENWYRTAYINCALFLIGSFVLWLGRYEQIVLYENGFLSVTFGRFNVMRWDDVDVLQINNIDEISFSGRKYYTIVSHTGASFTLQLGAYLWRHEKQLRAALEREVTQRLLPAAIATFEQGEVVIFGDLKVRKEGITGLFQDTSSSKIITTIPWSKIEDIQAGKRGIMLLKTNQGREIIPYDETVYNLCVFMELVRYILSLSQI